MLRKILEQIKEYQKIGPIRLHTLNDKIAETVEYKYTMIKIPNVTFFHNLREMANSF